MQNKFQLITIALVLGAALVSQGKYARAFDRQKLMSDGEVYAVALHDSYLAAAKEPETAQGDIAQYFESRAQAIENGADIAPAKPSAFPIVDPSMSTRLQWAYEEAADTVSSEAADVEPYLTANVEIAYERWLIAMHDNPKAPNADKLAAAFDQRLDDLTASPEVSALEAKREIQVAGSM